MTTDLMRLVSAGASSFFVSRINRASFALSKPPNGAFLLLVEPSNECQQRLECSFNRRAVPFSVVCGDQVLILLLEIRPKRV